MRLPSIAVFLGPIADAVGASVMGVRIGPAQAYANSRLRSRDELSAIYAAVGRRVTIRLSRG